MRPTTTYPVLLLLLLLACAGGSSEAVPPTEDPVSTDAPAVVGARFAADTLEEQTAARGSAAPGQEVVNLEGVGHDFGSADAPVRVVELMDFGCHHCRNFHDRTFPTLRAEYVETGRVFWKVVPFVLGSFPNSPAAAVAAECAARQGRFETMSDRLFEGQREWIRGDDAIEIVRRYAREEGLETVEFDACLRDPEIAQRIRTHGEIARRLGVRGTPTFFVLGHYRVPGAVPVDLFRQILDRALESESR